MTLPGRWPNGSARSAGARRKTCGKAGSPQMRFCGRAGASGLARSRRRRGSAARRRRSSVNPRYKQRVVLARDQYARPVMTMARFVPWGIPPEDGIPTIVLSRYLGYRRDHFTPLLRKLGVETYWASALDHQTRATRGLRMLVSEEDAARVIVHVRASDGARVLRAQEKARIAVERGARPGGSTGR